LLNGLVTMVLGRPRVKGESSFNLDFFTVPDPVVKAAPIEQPPAPVTPKAPPLEIQPPAPQPAPVDPMPVAPPPAPDAPPAMITPT
jgi:hypothetical protein